ncbi:MAG: hypothetical protein JHC71_12690 [Blastococcus sp.]|nr:hypothetical protein [Blastococcus sp.]
MIRPEQLAENDRPEGRLAENDQDPDGHEAVTPAVVSPLKRVALTELLAGDGWPG